MPTTAVELLVKNLSALEERIEAHSQSTKFSDSWGWQALPLDKTDLSYMVRTLKERIEAVDWSQSRDAEPMFSDLASKVDWAVQNTAPNLWSGPQASHVIIDLVTNLDLQVSSIVSPEQIRKTLLLPAGLKKYVAAASQRLRDATESVAGIESKVEAINAAYNAAERLPATQEDLAAALSDIDRAARLAERLNDKSTTTSQAVDSLKAKLEQAENEAQATLSKVREAYRAATSQGLAQAFSDKSNALNQSMLLWVLVLLASLTAAGVLAHQRFPEILAAVTGRPDWGVVLVNVALGALVVAPAIWVAWVATKQIGQRFRLAEDYAYKAALSTAYEGYRAEATKLDPLFEAQLFATALGRLDELPLRLVEPDVHGSPWHELISSQEFKDAVEEVPTLKDKIATIFRRDRMKNSSPTSPEK